MMLWKCCMQYASKFAKLSTGHRTGKGQFSFQSQRKALPKNVQTTAQLNSCHMPAKLCSKFSKLDFSSMWTKNFQMYKLDLGKAEEPDIKLPTSVGSLKKQESSRKTSTSVLLTMPKPLYAATAAKSLQSCPTLWDPIDSSPPDSPVPGILHARTLEWVAISFSNAWKWKVTVNSLSRIWLYSAAKMNCW